MTRLESFTKVCNHIDQCTLPSDKLQSKHKKKKSKHKQEERKKKKKKKKTDIVTINSSSSSDADVEDDDSDELSSLDRKLLSRYELKAKYIH